jgi:hypothetical protein
MFDVISYQAAVFNVVSYVVAAQLALDVWITHIKITTNY